MKQLKNEQIFLFLCVLKEGLTLYPRLAQYSLSNPSQF